MKLVDRAKRYVAELSDRLFFIPLAYVVAAIAFSQLSLAVDRLLDGGALPSPLQTTVESGRSILSTIAGGLIASVTLLLSLTLVAVQLASSQFSPRTLRNWIGDRTLQTTIGAVLGTSVYCLLILRDTRNFGESSGDGVASTLVPHVSVLVAVVLGVASLVTVVRAVDHLTDSLRVGTVAERILSSTLDVIAGEDEIELPDNPTVAPASTTSLNEAIEVPPGAFAVVADRSGWVDVIDQPTIFEHLPESSTAWITASVGTFALPGAPLMWIDHEDELDDTTIESLRSAWVLGSARTMEQDVGYGILRMTDIAIRALSPGVNDPNTANDMIMHLAVVLLRLWERPSAPAIREHEGRRLVRRPIRHRDYLVEAYDPIRRYGAADASVAETLIRTLHTLRTEVVRRELPGPLDPIDEMIDRVHESIARTDLLASEQARLRAIEA